MKTKEMEAFSKAFAPVIKSFFEQGIAAYSKKVDEQFNSLRKDISETKSFFEEALKNLPTPENGADGKDFPEEKAVSILTALAEKNLKSVEARIEKAEADLKETLDAFEMPKDGVDGVDGKDFPEEKAIEKIESLFKASSESFDDRFNSFVKEKSEAVDVAIRSIPEVKDGKDGKDGADYSEEKAVAKLEELTESKFETLETRFTELVDSSKKAVASAIEAIPDPKDGVDGKSVEIDDLLPHVKSFVEDEVENWTAGLPVPKDGADGKDGKSVSEEAVKQMLSELVSKATADIRVPKDGNPGEDGRDALQLEVLPAIEEGRSYPRGTYAKHAGGLWRAFERTHEMRGWECIVNGLSEIQIQSCGLREFKVSGIMSDNSVFEKSFTLPVMIYKGVYSEKASYDIGDVVTFGGSAWHSNVAENKSKPGTNNDWQLSVKKGRDYKEPTKREPVNPNKGVKIK